MPPVLTYIKIGVEFDPDASEADYFIFTKDGEPLPGKMFSVPSGIGMIVFNLTTVSTAPPPAAAFQTTPVQWLETGPDGGTTLAPVLLPDMFMFQRIGDQTVTLIDFNSNQSDDPHLKNHHFNLVVVYGGKTYGSDPTIVNEPPVG